MLPLHPIKLAHTPPAAAQLTAGGRRGEGLRLTYLVRVSTDADGYQVTEEVELIASSLSTVSTEKGIAHAIDRQDVYFVLQSRSPSPTQKASL